MKAQLSGKNGLICDCSVCVDVRLAVFWRGVYVQDQLIGKEFHNGTGSVITVNLANKEREEFRKRLYAQVDKAINNIKE